MFTIFLFLGLAWADAYDCVDCCKAAGLAGCPTRIRTVAPDSRVTQEGGGWRVNGLWLHDCEGKATFDDGATAVLVSQPRAGQVIRLASPPATIECFRKHCAVPSLGCIVTEDTTKSFFLMRCDNGNALSDAEMLVAGTTPVANTMASGPDLSLPEPPTRCATETGLIDAAQTQSFSADAKAAGGETSEAANQYRAALSIDPCNGTAWTGLGLLALNAGQNESAIQALETATRLLKDHADAWAGLGRGYEALGEVADATSAYGQAVAIHPDHPVAGPALKRIQATP